MAFEPGAQGCLPTMDRVFGPRVDENCRSFDFTLEFEDIVLTCIPVASFMVLLPVEVLLLLRKARKYSLCSKQYVIQTTILAAAFTLQLAFLILRTQNARLQSHASLAADVLSLVATLGALGLSSVNFQRANRPSTLLSLYVTASLILGIARARTLWLLSSAASAAGLMSALVGITFVYFLVDNLDYRSRMDVYEGAHGTSPQEHCAPEQFCGLWKRTTFSWLLFVFRLGSAKVLSLRDLPPLDSQLRSPVLREKLVSTWAIYKRRERHSLLRTCFRAYLPSFSSAIIPRLCLTVFTFSQPLLINTTVSWVEQKAPDQQYGKGLIGAWALVYLGLAISMSIYHYQLFRFLTRLRGGLEALVYQHILETHSSNSGEITAVSILGTDMPRIVESFKEIHELWAAPLDMAVAVWLLEQQLSVACVSPIVIALVFIAITAKLSVSTKREQRNWIEQAQERLRATTDMLSNMKAVKMLGLSAVMSAVVHKLRAHEIQTSKRFRVLLVVRIVLSNGIANLAPMATFGVYVIVAVYWKNESLLTAQAFTSISLIALLTKPVLVFIQALPAAIQCVGSFDRIQEYANYSNHEHRSDHEEPSGFVTTDSGHELTPQKSMTPDATKTKLVSLKGNSFSWSATGSPVLHDVDLQVDPGSFTVIVGPVGSGKSSLLHSILGETIVGDGLNGKQKRHPVAFCSQDAWLENTTARQNIIGPYSYDESWYNIVRTACALDSDLDHLSKGDHTMVGSDGSNLSGGQRQRIALARAVYSKCPIILLDDIFSGMDANTNDHISRQLLGPNGLLRKCGSTVLLATHNQQHISLAESVVIVEGGRVRKATSPATLNIQDGSMGALDHKLSGNDGPVEDERTSRAGNDSLNQPKACTQSTESLVDDSDQSLADIRRKSGDPLVYKYYFASSGWLTVTGFFLSLVLWIFCTEFPTIWIKWWAEANERHPNENVGMYMGVFVLLGVTGVLMVFAICWTLFIRIISNTAHKLHDDLLNATLGAPYQFFAKTDSGSLTNRFSQDLELVDMELPVYVVNYGTAAAQCLAKIIILAIFSRYLAITVPFLCAAVFFLQRYYLQTSRQVRLLGIEAKAPLYTSFQEAVAGSTTIRAFGWQQHYQARNAELIDASQRPQYLQFCIQQWLTFVLDFIVAVMVVILVTIVVTLQGQFDAGSVGVSLTAVVSFNIVLARVIQMWTGMESSIGAVARIKQFVGETDSESKGTGPSPSPLPGWPHAGAIAFENLTAAHGPEAEPILKAFTLAIEPAEHVAICGRSGSGKTSMILSVLKMIDVQGGDVTIDSVSIADMAAEVVRSNVTVITQEPFLLPGSIKFNLDPREQGSEGEMTRVLERVGLADLLKEHGLDGRVDWATWSSGQKQMLCFARAMMQRNKIIILDEATSSVDTDTESRMQDIIDTEFRGCTVLAVLHRLAHITRYDRVALLDNGCLAEYDRPAELLAGDTKFKRLYGSYSRSPST